LSANDKKYSFIVSATYGPWAWSIIDWVSSRLTDLPLSILINYIPGRFHLVICFDAIVIICHHMLITIELFNWLVGQSVNDMNSVTSPLSWVS
jgi:hypothetical protein